MRPAGAHRGDEDRLRLPADPGVFGDGEVAGLPDPVVRYLRAAIAPGAPLVRAADLDMRGRLRLDGRWLRLRAHEVLAPHEGFVWRARVAGVIAGSDRYVGGRGQMAWRLLGLARVAHAEGEDVARSAAGRAAGEAVWVPTSLLPRFGVRWDVTSEHDLHARLKIDGIDVTLHLRTDADDRVEWVRFDRWGDPDETGEWGMHPFGFQVTETRRFGPFSIPAAGSAGWFHGTDRWADSRFFECDITSLDPVVGPVTPASRRPIMRATAEDMTSLAADVGPAPMQVGAILLLDTRGGFDLAAGRDALARRIRSVPRLRQRLQPVPVGCGRPIWVDHEAFDVDQHVTIVDQVPGGDLTAVLALGADVVATRLPRDRPLWAATFAPIDSESAALVLVFHHVLADGIGGLAVLGGLVDETADAADAEGPSEFPVPMPTPGHIAFDALGGRIRSLARLPGLPRRVHAALAELRATGSTRASRTSLNRPTGPRRRLAMASCDLSAIVGVAHDHGGSVNDVVLAAIDGALSTLVGSRVEVAERFVVSVPVSRRRATTATDLGNQVGVAPIELPGLADRGERLRVIVGRGALIRSAPHGASAALLGPLFRLLAKLGCLRWFINRQRLVNSFVTNLRGPEQRLHFLGAAITDVLPVVGISGNVTVSFAVFSYAGTLSVTIIADPDAMDDLDLLREALQDELDGYLRLRPEAIVGDS